MTATLVSAARTTVLAALGLILISAVASAAPFVRLQTDRGDIVLELQPELAPNHAASFAHLARTGFYDGTYFHRIVPGFVIQGGDPNTRNDDPRDDGIGGPKVADVLPKAEFERYLAARAAADGGDEAAREAARKILADRGYVVVDGEARLVAEFSRTAKHLRGTLSMARAQDPDSGGSQFFVCVDDVTRLDGQYTIFGVVLEGMDVVDAIVSAPTDPAQPQRPVEPVRIVAATVADSREGLAAGGPTGAEAKAKTQAAPKGGK